MNNEIRSVTDERILVVGEGEVLTGGKSSQEELEELMLSAKNLSFASELLTPQEQVLLHRVSPQYRKNPAILEKRCFCGGLLVRDEFKKIHCIECEGLKLQGKKLVKKVTEK